MTLSNILLLTEGLGKFIFILSFLKWWRVPWCAELQSEFDFQLRYYIYFRTNSIEKDMNRFFPLAMG